MTVRVGVWWVCVLMWGSAVKPDNYHAVVNEGVNVSALCQECDTSTGSGYAQHPVYCHLFVHCSLGGDGLLRGEVKECTRGLLWSSHHKQCVWPQQSDCPKNPCLSPLAPTFRDVRNCNGFFSCPNGLGLRYSCCHSAHRYSAQLGTCVLDPTCNDPCLLGSANITAQIPECDLHRVEGDPSQYVWSNGGRNVTMTCAAGTLFSEDHCSCSQFSSPSSQETVFKDRCEPFVHFPFDEDLKDVRRNTASGSSADMVVYDRRLDENNRTVNEGAAYFRGSQQVVAWALNNMEFGSNFTLGFKFKVDQIPLPGSGAGYALIDNSDCDKEATFGVALNRTGANRGTVHGGFRLKDGLPYTASSGELLLGDWHVVVLMKHGSRAELIVDDTHYPMQGQGLHNDIERVDCSMTIGTGTGLNGFYGYIDEVKYYKCVPDHYL